MINRMKGFQKQCYNKNRPTGNKYVNLANCTGAKNPHSVFIQSELDNRVISVFIVINYVIVT